MRLLYVEDEVSLARTIEALLRWEGYEFDTAHCGQEAIDLAKANKYDLILLDIMLPDIDGYEVINRLRLSGDETPFLVQTGLIDRGDENATVSLGVTEYLLKPFNKNELINGIEAAVERATRERLSNPIQPARKSARWWGLERREHRRFVTVKSARVVWPTEFDCVILNLSYGGAALSLPTASQNLPSEFGMEIRGDTLLKCQVCWRLGDKVGVKFNWTDAQRRVATELSDELAGKNKKPWQH